MYQCLILTVPFSSCHFLFHLPIAPSLVTLGLHWCTFTRSQGDSSHHYRVVWQTLYEGIARICSTKKSSHNLNDSKLVNLYDNLPLIFECFMTYNMPRSVKKCCESTEPQSWQAPKMFVILLPLLLFFRQASSKLRNSFTMVFAQNSSILHWAVHQPIASSQFRSLTRQFEPDTKELQLH